MWFLVLFALVNNISGDLNATGICDRYWSRIARRIVTEKVLSVVTNKGYELPMDCPFNPKLDRLLDDEQKGKEKIRASQWKCLYCSKLFTQEHWLDQHLDRRHLPDMSKSTCLANYCNILRCKALEFEDMDQDLATVPTAEPCNPSVKALDKHTCEAVNHKCFPSEKSSLAHTLHDQMNEKICEPLSCSYRKKEKGGRSRLYYVLVALVVLLLVMYYIAVLLWRSETSTSKDLRKMKQIRNTSSGWFRQRKRRVE